MRLFRIILVTIFPAVCWAQTTYYISSSGNNSNSGTSKSSPWKSITSIDPGSTYLLKSGDTLYFNIPDTKKSTENKNTVITSYGEGPKPIVSLYKKIKPEKWTLHSDNIWKVNLSDSENYTGYKTLDNNVGFLKVDSKIFGNKKLNSESLAANWDFYSDQTTLYIYSTRSPQNVAKSIESNCNITAIRICNNLTISNIKIMGTGAHALSGYLSKNVTLRNIDITEIGGSLLPGFSDGTVRYGNGIQFYDGSDNCIIENCNISQVYDTALTLQGDSKTTLFNNTTFKNNVISNNEQSFEVWVKNGGPGFINCKFIDNDCSNAGYGWSHVYRPAKYVGVHLLSYVMACVNTDILIEGNTFYKAKSGLYFYFDSENAPKYVSRNNKVTLNANVPIRSLSPITSRLRFDVTNPDNFIQSTGYEKGTVFKTLDGVRP
jgi:parallel beta-helix repeat protein